MSDTTPRLDPNTKGTEALNALKEAGAQASKLLSLWLEHNNAEAVLAAARAAPGNLRKDAKRALKTLKTRGVMIPTKRAGLGEQTDFEEQAWILPPDGSFSTLLILARRSQTSRYKAVFLYVSLEIGIQKVDVSTLSRSAMKEALQRTLGKSGNRAVAVPPAWIRQRVAQMVEAQKAAGRLLPFGLSAASDLLSGSPDEECPHPFDAEGFELSEEDANELSKSSRELHSFPEYRAWFPPKAAVDEMLREVGKALKPGEPPPEEELRKHLDDAIVAATDRFFTPERRKLIGEAMRDGGLAVLERKGEAEALKVAATISAIESAGLITNPPSGVPFLTAFFEKAVSLLIAQGGGKIQIPIANPPPRAAGVEEATEGTQTQPSE